MARTSLSVNDERPSVRNFRPATILINSVNGAVESPSAFDEAWTARTGRVSEVVTGMRMYRLREMVWPQGVSGAAAVATIFWAGPV